MRLAPLVLLLVLAACERPKPPQPVPVRPTADTTAPAPTPPDPFEHVTDGDAIALPQETVEGLVAEDSLWQEALRVHYNAIVMDGHIDTPMWMLREGYRLDERHTAREGDADLPRMQEGGLDAPFFSIYVSAGYGEAQAARQRYRAMIEEVRRQVEADTSVALAVTAEDVRRIAKEGRTAILMGLEGGHATGGDPRVVEELADLGVRYVTLTHVNTNSFADASQSPPRHGGLTERGRALVRALNRHGLLVDLSHTSDSTFFDAVAVSEAPVILSHSSARGLVPAVRNASDAMLRALAENGGVAMVNFFDPLVNPALTQDVFDETDRRLRAAGLTRQSMWRIVYDVKRERGLGGATIEDVLDHIDHVVQVAGIDHVALGSDFDGVKDLPRGLYDVTRLPWITYGLLQRGYTEGEIYKILGGNTLRVLEEAERVAARSSAFRVPSSEGR